MLPPHGFGPDHRPRTRSGVYGMRGLEPPLASIAPGRGLGWPFPLSAVSATPRSMLLVRGEGFEPSLAHPQAPPRVCQSTSLACADAGPRLSRSALVPLLPLGAVAPSAAQALDLSTSLASPPLGICASVAPVCQSTSLACPPVDARLSVVFHPPLYRSTAERPRYSVVSSPSASPPLNPQLYSV